MRLIFIVLALFAGQLVYGSSLSPHLLDAPVQVGFVSSNLRITKGKSIQVVPKKTWELTAWRGEKVNVQVLAKFNRNVKSLKATAGVLRSKKGKTLPGIEVGYLKYVLTDEFGNGCGHRKSSDFDSSLVSDAIVQATSVQVNQDEYQPIWLSLSIPQDAVADQYTTTITVKGDQSYTLNLSLKVIDRVLPAPSAWKYDLDLWQHPAAIARVHKVALWSDAHFEKMRPYYTMLAKAGQKNITTSIIDEPWGHQTYDDFPSLIKWVKRADGTWKYDYSLFDKYVSFVMSCGISARINCYTMVPWKLSFAYYDEKSQKNSFLAAKPGSKEYNEFWSAMLKDFAIHLKAKGWFEKTTIAMDERPMKDMQAVIALLKSVDPQWKIALAGDYHREIEADIFDYSIASKSVFPDDVLAARLAAGKPSTVYTCCTEPYPNGFTFSPPAENAWLSWYAAAKGFTGYLRWAYNSWPKDPSNDSRFTAWPAGDTYQVYPNAVTSIRFEKMIEGIQDFEKIELLKAQWKKEGNNEKLNELSKLLLAFDIKALETKSAEEMMVAGKDFLNR